MMGISTVTYNSKAVRLSRELLQDIENGVFGPGSVLPSQIELAGRYQVSRDTVQRALSLLNDEGKVRRLSQGKTQVPMDFGRQESTSSDRTVRGNIAAVWAAEPDYHLVEMRKGIARYAAETGMDFKIFLSPGGHGKTIELLGTIENHSVDGIILLPYGHPDYVRAIRRLIDRAFPVVCIDRLVEGVQASCVHFDNASGMYEATQYLITRYSRPVYYVGHLLDHSTVIADYEGYRHAMADAGFAGEIAKYTCLGGTSDSDPRFWPLGQKWLGAKEGIDQFFNKAVFPASVMCVNDYVAQGIYETAASRNLKIGADISIAGFGDYPLSQFLSPMLTTVRTPMVRMGYDAAGLLDQTIQKKFEPPVQIYLPVELVVRESTGEPK